MTRLVTCGWETGDPNEIGISVGTGTPLAVTSTPTPRTPGVYCWRRDTTGSSSLYRDISIGTKTEAWVRLAVFFHGLTSQQQFIAFVDSGGTTQGTLEWNNADRFLRVYRGAGTTLLGTSTSALPADEWHTVDVRWQITSATVGIVEVWVDDTQWLNLTGIDNTQSANTNFQTVRLGVTAALGAGVYFAMDDLAINDAAGTINNGRVGDGRVVLLKPTGAGSNTSQTRGGTDTGANWSQVSEVPPSMAQYVYSATAATRDTYAMQDLPAGSWSVNTVEVLALAMNSDTGAGSLGLTVKSGATTNEGAAQSLTTSQAYYRQQYETDPNTGAAWTTTAVNAAEAGTTVR